MGNAKQPSRKWQGGHLIEVALGGPTVFDNLFPKNSNFNQGCWRVLEKAADSCRKSKNKITFVKHLHYPNNTMKIPTLISSDFVANQGPLVVGRQTFENKIRGGNHKGQPGEEKVNIIRAALKLQGC